jgi:uncharacterized damage-inducible protein DinB
MRPHFATSTAACGALILVCAGLHAQNPVAGALQKLTTRAARNLIESAQEMPGDKYGYKPTPAQMTFGEVVVHLADGNGILCGSIAGTPAPQLPKLTPQDSKDTLVSRLKQSFDFCTAALGRVDDTKLADSIPFFGSRKVTRAMAMMITVDDWADHYSQLAIYLRLNGLLPPTAKKKEG